MKIKSGSDEIDFSDNLDELRAIPVGKCLKQKAKMKLGNEEINTDIEVCRVRENKWSIKGKVNDEEEEIFEVNGEITID